MPKRTAKVGMFTFRVSEQETAEIQAAANRAGRPVTAWVREIVLMASRRS